MAVQFILFNFANLLFLRFLPYLSRVFSASKKNPCYYCDFLRYMRRFGALLGFFSFSKSRILLNLLFFSDFCDSCDGCFQLARKILVTFAIFARFADISGPFLVSSFSKSGILLNLLFLRYLSRMFSDRKKNPCYFCDFCEICGHFGALLGFFFF